VSVADGPSSRRYPLERYARDARAAALMRPWTQEIAMQQAYVAELLRFKRQAYRFAPSY